MRFARLEDLYNVLPNPGPAFRSLPFWGWNARMEPGELRRQIADMKDKGMGGAFIHSREGLETPYLSEEWMEDVRCCAEACAREGLELWIYDEDKWPSGSAGGMVAAANMAGKPEKMTDFFASKSTMSFLGINTMSLGMVTPEDDSYRVDTYDKDGVYKKIVSKDGVIVGALLQGDLAYGGVLQQMIARKLDVRRVKKPLFDIDYSDFFHVEEDHQFAYKE